jgi:hypothetical protein
MKSLALVALILGGCGSDPVDAEGSYTIALTNRDNGCNFTNWTVGNTASNIGVAITQQSDNAVADVQGGAMTVLDLWLGSHTFSGKVDGDHLKLTLTGTRSQTTGNCTWTVDGVLDATLTGDVLEGRINYVGNGNSNTDCAAVTGCVTYQDFNGTRPPQ